MKYVTVTTNRKTGVYGIRHVPSGRMYIGGSVNITNRYTFHRFTLRRGVHTTKELQELWTRDGETSFQFMILEICRVEELREREQAWHDKTSDSLNTLKGVDHTGEKRSAASRLNYSIAAIERWKRPEYRMKQSKKD